MTNGIYGVGFLFLLTVWGGFTARLADVALAGAPPARWTSSRVAGSPDPPPPYRVERVFSELSFDRPTVMTHAPGMDRLFVAEQHGKIFSFPDVPGAANADLLADLNEAGHGDIRAIYGLAFHPRFVENGYAYICYVVAGDREHGTRVSRFRFNELDPPRLDLATERLIMTWRSGGHNGGCLKFGPDGYLYISTGDADAASPPDSRRVGQDVSNVLSAILRIDIDTPDDGPAYRIPADNPFADRSGARGEIWSYGFRNPWKMSFDRSTGHLWVGDVGWELWEMIYRVQRGGNYGWSVMEGPQPVHPQAPRGPTPILPPTLVHSHSEAASITGGFVYRGSRLPELRGAYIYGDFQSGLVWGARMEGDRASWHEQLARTPLQLVAFGEDRAGALYLVDLRGQIYRLAENPTPDRSRDFPRRLAETGLFESTPAHALAGGVVPYSINAEPWADETRATRFLGVPDPGQITIDAAGKWQFPEGTVLGKTVTVQMQHGVESSVQRLETQLLHYESGAWRAYSYAWNEAGTDAALVESGGFERTLRVRDPRAPGGIREQVYRFAGRQECMLCHNPWVLAKTTVFGVQSASPLAMDVPQWNRRAPAAEANQLEVLAERGMLQADVPALLESHAPFADPYDDRHDLEDRARAYLHVNCAHCHQFNAGGAATIVLSHDVPLDKTRTIGVRPTQGAFGIAAARIIAPRDPHGSVLWYRIAKRGGGRMPRVGSREVDVRGVQLMHDWIGGLPGDSGPPPQPQQALERWRATDSTEKRLESIESLLGSTRGALALMQAVGSANLKQPVRQRVIELGAAHPESQVRDLFERFVPAAQRIKRLGTIVNPADILALEGDASRGRNVFFHHSAAACKNCHRLDDQGVALGPDLTAIGKKYNRAQMLQHILEPSRFMEPAYVPYVAETVDGRITVGLLAEKTDRRVVLKDASNRHHPLAAEDIVQLAQQSKSLMPELLLRDLTRQEVADLLTFLESLKGPSR